MTREEKMEVFEKACASWGFDFTKSTENPNGLTYADYNTGIMFGMFIKGFESSKDLIVNKCISHAKKEEERYYTLGCDNEALTMENFQGVLKEYFGVK